MIRQGNVTEEVGAEDSPSRASIAAPQKRFGMQRVLAQTRSWKSLLTLQPFDVATEQGRSRERYRRAALTTITSGVARGVTVITWLVTVRLTVRYLGTERYGLWMTITSLVAMMAFADLGLGNGLLNSITEAKGGDDRESVRRYVSSAFFLLLGIATVLLGLFVLVYALIPWPRVFNVVTTVATREAGPAVFVFVACFALNMPLDTVQRVQIGYQEGFETNLWVAAGSLMGLSALLVAMHFQVGLPGLLLSISGGQLLGVFGNWSREFLWARPWLLPDLACWDADAARKLLRTGVMFLILTVSSTFTAPVDNIIISQILGPEAVTQYAVPMRLFLIVVSLSLLFVVPLWPAYGEAMARRDVQWVRATLTNSLRYSLGVFGPLALVLALSGKLIVRIWVGSQIHPSYAMLLGMGTWAVIAIFGNALATFFNGTNHLKVQVFTAILMAITNLILKLVFTRYAGLWAVPWATVLSSIPAIVIQVAYASRLLSTPGVFSPVPTSAVPQP